MFIYELDNAAFERVFRIIYEHLNSYSQEEMNANEEWKFVTELMQELLESPIKKFQFKFLSWFLLIRL